MGGLASWLTRRAAEHTKRSAVQSKNEFFKDFPRQNVYSTPDPGIGTKLPRQGMTGQPASQNAAACTVNDPTALVPTGWGKHQDFLDRHFRPRVSFGDEMR